MNPCGGASSDREPMDRGRSLYGRGFAPRFLKSVAITAQERDRISSSLSGVKILSD